MPNPATNQLLLAGASAFRDAKLEAANRVLTNARDDLRKLIFGLALGEVVEDWQTTLQLAQATFRDALLERNRWRDMSLQTLITIAITDIQDDLP
jgi:hypothetical protein